jgi:hypothetical protein
LFEQVSRPDGTADQQTSVGMAACGPGPRIRRNPGIFARIRSFAYNILRFNQSDTIAQDRYAAALGGLKSLVAMNFYKQR